MSSHYGMVTYDMNILSFHLMIVLEVENLTFAVRLRESRERKGLSLQKLADMIGASKAHIWDLEKGRTTNPSLEILVGLSRALDVSIANLVGEDTEQTPNNGDTVAMFRDLQTLSDSDRETIKLMMDRLRIRPTDL